MSHAAIAGIVFASGLLCGVLLLAPFLFLGGFVPVLLLLPVGCGGAALLGWELAEWTRE